MELDSSYSSYSSYSSSGTASPTSVPLPVPTLAPSIPVTGTPTSMPSPAVWVKVSASSTVTVSSGFSSPAEFNQGYADVFKASIRETSSLITKASQITGVNATASTSRRRKLLATSLDIAFTVAIDLTSLGYSFTDASTVVSSFATGLASSLNSSSTSGFSSVFSTQSALAGVSAVTMVVDVTATASALSSMSTSIVVETISPAPTSLPTIIEPTPNPTITSVPTPYPTIDKLTMNESEDKNVAQFSVMGGAGMVFTLLLCYLCISHRHNRSLKQRLLFDHRARHQEATKERDSGVQAEMASFQEQNKESSSKGRKSRRNSFNKQLSSQS